jgi:hypothetical protein
VATIIGTILGGFTVSGGDGKEKEFSNQEATPIDKEG